MIKLPTQNLNSYEIDATLDDRGYILRFDWNAEGQAWVMGIGQSNGEDVLRGIMLVPNVPLLRGWHYLRVPPGEIVAITDDPYAQIKRDNFTLYYVTEAEIAEI